MTGQTKWPPRSKKRRIREKVAKKMGFMSERKFIKKLRKGQYRFAPEIGRCESVRWVEVNP